MNIMLGNLSVKQIEERLSITLTEEDKDKLVSTREEYAQNIPYNKWHCFDIPFMIVCGSMDTAIIVRDILAPYSDKMQGTIQIGISKQ